MLNMLKKAFWVPYKDGSVYPTVSKAHPYEIYRGYETGSRGNYGVKCREK